MVELLIEKLKAYPMDMATIKEFFKSRNIDIDKIKDKTISYDNNELFFYGTYPKIEDKILVDYKVRVPKVKNLYDALIFVHETTHGLILDDHLDRLYIENDIFDEVLPMLYEDYFINFLVNQKGLNVKDLYNMYTEEVFKDIYTDSKYIIGRLVIDQYYHNNQKKMIIK